ncbi:MAG: ABC transporter ATP-binding protein [Caldilineaceae bacterium]
MGFYWWHKAAHGQVTVNGYALDAGHLETLRRVTAWVDPSVQIWNRSFMENLLYGNEQATDSGLGLILTEADLYDVMERLPRGLQTTLGENGGLVSGGEGQRVRLGRALLRPDVQLAILDEPFADLTVKNATGYCAVHAKNGKRRPSSVSRTTSASAKNLTAL